MAEKAFQALKAHFMSTPIVQVPEHTRQFDVEVDALDVGVGAVLSQRSSTDQKLHPCVFFSRSPAERNYNIVTSHYDITLYLPMIRNTKPGALFWQFQNEETSTGSESFLPKSCHIAMVIW